MSNNNSQQSQSQSQGTGLLPIHDPNYIRRSNSVRRADSQFSDILIKDKDNNNNVLEQQESNIDEFEPGAGPPIEEVKHSFTESQQQIYNNLPINNNNTQSYYSQQPPDINISLVYPPVKPVSIVNSQPLSVTRLSTSSLPQQQEQQHQISVVQGSSFYQSPSVSQSIASLNQQSHSLTSQLNYDPVTIDNKIHNLPDLHYSLRPPSLRNGVIMDGYDQLYGNKNKKSLQLINTNIPTVHKAPKSLVSIIKRNEPQTTTVLGKPIYDGEKSELYNTGNPTPPYNVLKQMSQTQCTVLIDDAKRTYIKADEHWFNAQWYENKMKALTFNRNTDEIYWVRNESSRGGLVKSWPNVCFNTMKKFINLNTNAELYYYIIETSTGEIDRKPRARNTGYVVLRKKTI